VNAELRHISGVIINCLGSAELAIVLQALKFLVAS